MPEVLERVATFSVNPELMKNCPQNADNMTYNEIMEHIKRGISDIRDGRCMPLRDFDKLFRGKYGI